MAKKLAARKAFTTYHPDLGINAYWVRSEARMVRSAIEQSGRGWERVKAAGWRVVRVKIVPDFKRRA